MTKSCPICEVMAPADARYCRHCGATLQRIPPLGNAANVSPLAATVPLSGQNTTDEIAANQPPQSNASHTSEVTREEMDDLLGDARRSSSKEQRAASSANSADRTSAVSGVSSDDAGPEQTEITIPVRPLTSRNLPADTAAVAARSRRAPHFNPAPRQVTPSPKASPATSTVVSATPTPVRSIEARALRMWVALAALSILVICGVAAALLWFGVRNWRTTTPATTTSSSETPAAPVVASDPKQLANAKLSEADMLLASGDTSAATARLREAAALDPSNAEPHRRLARLLLAGGARRAGIEELRAVTRIEPSDAEAWRGLASAQSAEGLYHDAVESYRGLSEASPSALAADAVQLAYADALRRAGRTAEARTIYRRLASSTDAAVARASKQQLRQTERPDADDDGDTARAQAEETEREQARAEANRTAEDNASATLALKPAAPRAEPPPPATSNTSALSPAERYQRGVNLWATNRAAAVMEFRAAAERGHADANYYLGLSLAEGRDPRALKRAELIAALVHFGRARKSKFRAQAATYEDRLGRELDRRRKQTQ